MTEEKGLAGESNKRKVPQRDGVEYLYEKVGVWGLCGGGEGTRLASIGNPGTGTGGGGIGVRCPGKVGCLGYLGCLGMLGNDTAVLSWTCKQAVGDEKKRGKTKENEGRKHSERLSHAITVQKHRQDWLQS